MPGFKQALQCDMRPSWLERFRVVPGMLPKGQRVQNGSGRCSSGIRATNNLSFCPVSHTRIYAVAKLSPQIQFHTFLFAFFRL